MTVSVVKKNMNMDCTFGVKTVDGTASAGSEFHAVDEVCTMKKKEIEKTINIQIIDNHDWQPDLDFYLEIYDTKNGERLYGDDTRCRITILDEDFPGKLGFELTELTASRLQDKVDIIIKRNEGTDGKISCMVRTEPLVADKFNSVNAIEFEDYLPKHEKIEFLSGESEKLVSIQLVKESVAGAVEGKAQDIGIEKRPDEPAKNDPDESEDDFGPRFKVVLEKPEPE